MIIKQICGVPAASIKQYQGSPKADIKRVAKEWFVAPSPALSLRVTFTVAASIALPIIGGGAGYSHNFTVDWGDGSAQSTVTAYNDADRIHAYTIGTYDILMVGTCEYFAVNNINDATTMRSRITSVISITGDMGFKVLNFFGCTLMTSTVALGELASLTTAGSIYRQTGLTSVPIYSFHGCPQITSFDYAFYQCTSLTIVPADLFSQQSGVTSFSNCFRGCTNLDTISEDIFANAWSAANFSYVFSGTKISSIPATLFKFCPVITDMSYAFSLCTSLTSVPDYLFAYCPLITTFERTFDQCSNLATLGGHIFEGCTQVTSFARTFYGIKGPTIPSTLFDGIENAVFTSTFTTSKLTSIPAGLFDSCTGSSSIYQLFRDCTSLNTDIPQGLFDNLTGLTNAYQCFYGCTALPGCGSNLFKNCTSCVGYQSVFEGCVKFKQRSDLFYAAGEQSTRFHDQSPTFNSCFSRTSFSGTQGTAPDLWNCDFGTGTPTTTLCWSGAGNYLTALTNVNDIPGRLMTIDVQPATAWAVGDLITGATSGATVKIVAQVTGTTYQTSIQSKAFTLGEIIGVVGNTADQGTTRPVFGAQLWG